MFLVLCLIAYMIFARDQVRSVTSMYVCDMHEVWGIVHAREFTALLELLGVQFLVFLLLEFCNGFSLGANKVFLFSLPACWIL